MKTKSIDKKNIDKILVIKLRGIGDVVLSTIIFDSLRDAFPKAKIDFLVDKPGSFGLSTLPFLNDVIIFEKKSSLKRISQFLDIRKRKYDLVIDLFSNPTTAQITFISGAEFRVGFPYKGRKYAYNIFGPEERDKLHSADLHLELIKSAGIKITKKNLYFGLDDASVQFARNFFSENFPKEKLVVGVSPSGGWASKKCDPQKFAEIANAVQSEYDAEILILWGPEDKIEAEEISRLMNGKSTLAPATSIVEMAAMISECDALIANDSGPMHISTALATPALSLHGPTDPKLQGPFGDKHEAVLHDELDCIICHHLECPRKHECFLELPLEKVMNKFDILLRKNNLIPR